MEVFMADTTVRITNKLSDKLDKIKEVVGMSKKTIIEKLVENVNLDELKRTRRI